MIERRRFPNVQTPVNPAGVPENSRGQARSEAERAAPGITPSRIPTLKGSHLSAKVSLITIDTILWQQLPKLVLERCLLVMLFLPLDVLAEGRHIRSIDAKCFVPILPDLRCDPFRVGIFVAWFPGAPRSASLRAGPRLLSGTPTGVQGAATRRKRLRSRRLEFGHLRVKYRRTVQGFC